MSEAIPREWQLYQDNDSNIKSMTAISIAILGNEIRELRLSNIREIKRIL